MTKKHFLRYALLILIVVGGLYGTHRYFNPSSVVCPCCEGHFKEFLPLGVHPRLNAKCPECDLLERHRLLWLYLKERTNFFTDNLKVLHIGPMPWLQEKFCTLPNLDYVSGDIVPGKAMVQMDITDIKLPDNQFDCILCYHVLEHVTDDQKAMRELFRVLKPGGWAILQSPIDYTRKETFEDPSVTSPEERERLFGQSDHLRMYGRDYKERLEKAGFVVKVDDYVKKLPNRLIKKYGLDNTEDICFCTKPN